MADILKGAADIDLFGPDNAGVEIAIIEPESADVLYVINSGKSFYMLVNNLSAANEATLTIDTPGTTTNIEVPIGDYVYTATVSKQRQIGPFTPVATFNTASGDPVQAASVKCTFTGTIIPGELQVSLIEVS